MSEKKVYKLYLDIVPTQNESASFSVTGATLDNAPVSYMIKRSDGKLYPTPQNDFYINIPLFKTERTFEYIDLKIEEDIYKIERQNFNPFFIEYGFFESVTKNRIENGNDLNKQNIDFIRKVRADVNSKFSDTSNDIQENSPIRLWYDEFGKYEFPWNAGESNETTKSDLDNSSTNPDFIVSKAKFYPIDINN